MNIEPKAIKEARTEAGLTQEKAAALIHVGKRTWINWEMGHTAMHPAFFELFTIKANRYEDSLPW